MHLNNYYDINTAYDYDFTAYYHYINKADYYNYVCSANHDNISSAHYLYEFNKADYHHFSKHNIHVGSTNHQYHDVNYY
jgi:hypothetical protein